MAMHFPGHAIPPELRPADGSDGLFHCIAYLMFSFVICRAFDALHRRKYPTVNPPALIYLFIFFLCVTYGYVDEETQPWTGRTSDSADWEANVLGSLLGVCAHLFVSVFFTADPGKLLVDRINSRRGHRRRRHRSRHRSDEHRSSDGSSTDESRSSGDNDGEQRHSEGRRRRRRRRRSSAETHDGTGASDATIDDSPPVDRPADVPLPEPAPPPHDTESHRGDEPGTA